MTHSQKVIYNIFFTLPDPVNSVVKQSIMVMRVKIKHKNMNFQHNLSVSLK